MKPTKIKSVFENEAALCAAFIASLPEGWTAYAETGGFDILLVRAIDGAQVGVEAKMTLNAKVLMQAVEGIYAGHGSGSEGPDFRAALVPYGSAGAEMKSIATYLGVTVIECRTGGEGEKQIESEVAKFGEYYRPYASKNYEPFKPELPHVGYQWRETWVDYCPLKRCPVPDYVPDVVAGASGPSQLSEWKIKAIKICVLLERRGHVTIADFKHIKIDRKRWLDFRWLKPTPVRGQYVAGSLPLDLRSAHPVNFGQIESDFEKWKPKEVAAAEPMAALL
jgi:hypothetical protein